MRHPPKLPSQLWFLICFNLLAGPVAMAQMAGIGAQGAVGMATTPITPIGAASQHVIQASVGTSYSDNVYESSVEPVGQAIGSAGLRIDEQQSGTNLGYSVLSDLNWVEYLQNAYRGQLQGYLNGSLTAMVVPQRFGFTLQESYSQQVINPLLPPTPDNTENVNYFTVGPLLALPLGADTRLTIATDYSKVNTQSDAPDPPVLDSQRYSGSVQVARALSALSKLALDIGTEHAEFDPLLRSDYTRTDGLLDLSVRGARTDLDIQTGATALRDYGKTSTGFLGRFDLARKITPRSTILLHASQEVGDGADLFRNTFDQNDPLSYPFRVATTDVYRDTELGSEFRFQTPRTSIGADIALFRERFQVATQFDRTGHDESVYIERHLTPLLSLRAEGHYGGETYNTTRVEDQYYEVVAAILYRLGARLGLELDYDRYQRMSTLADGAFRENRVGARLTYDIIPPH